MLLIFSPGLVVPNALAAIPSDIKTSLDADKHKKEIHDTVAAEVVELGGTDPVKRSKAREALCVEVNAPGNAPYSGTFLDLYAQEINTQLKDLATNADPKIRLNVAIVVARVAEKVDSSRLFDVTDILLNDKSDAIVNWALKAARYVVPPALQAGMQAQQQKLLADIKAQAAKPALLSLVYEALSLNYTAPSAAKGNAPGWNKMVQQALPEILDLMKSRTAIYLKQVPPEPTAEERAVGFLTSPQVLKQVTAPQQVQIVQALSDLLNLSAHRAAMTGAGAEQAQLKAAAQNAASGLSAIAIFVQQNALAQELERIARGDPANAGTLQQIDQLPAKFKAIPAWGSVQSPPKLEGGATTSSAPTTAPAK